MLGGAPGRTLRLFKIARVLSRHGVDELALTIPLFRRVRFLTCLLPGYWMRDRDAPRAVRMRKSLEELGPIFVKFGQILSTRRDLLPDDIATEFARLQDDVPPFPSEQARTIIEEAYGKPLGEVFQQFDDAPLASASIAQVHAARLHDGREVVVKVVRPGIEQTIRRDLELMYLLAGMVQRYWSDGRRLRPVEVVREYEKTIFDELDMLREGSNASLLRRNFDGSPLIYIPEVYWPYVRRNVMVMERISGIPISDIEAIKAAGIDLQQLAERGVEIFFTQAFRHNFFHADMHPGNIFVAPDGRYIAVDFGIMGSLNPEDQRYLAENFLAFFQRDYQRVAELHVESGWVPRGTRVDEFESAIRAVCEPIFERPLKEISFGHLLLRLFQTARRFNMEIQPQLVLLQKTLLNIEGLGRQLYPDLDLWKTAKPFLERWMQNQVGARAFVRNLRQQAPRIMELTPEIPLLAHSVLKQLQRGTLETNSRSAELNRLRREIRSSNRRTVGAIAGSTLILSAVLILGMGGHELHGPGDLPLASWLLGAAGGLLLLVSWPLGDAD
ncbi:MAG TPA: ubiquinone biosynthesis regulatory protein kinase UbiB [Gammaproteobacteria bacterium]|nr:ubiquinone biosynthesis regulatory protein kinase UbiB [Gammaproteobacteria bacterium]